MRRSSSAQFTVALALLLLLAAPLVAQQRPTDRARATLRVQDTPVKQTFNLDIGYVNTSGNTRVTTFNIGDRYGLSAGRWRFEQFAAVVYGENDGEVNTNFIRAGVGGEFAFTPRLGLAGGALYDRNRFAGIAQRTEEYIGLVWRALEAERDSLRFDAGTSLTQQLGTDGMRTQFPAARTAFFYKHVFAPKSFFLQSVEVIPNLQTQEDYRINTVSQLISPLAGNMAVKLEYVVRYDNLPEPEFKTTDRIFTTGLQISF